MKLTEHQDFQMMPVRGELIENSRILAEPGKDLFRCRSVYTSKATVKATDMMGVARALVTVFGTVEIVDTPIASPQAMGGLPPKHAVQTFLGGLDCDFTGCGSGCPPGNSDLRLTS